jgi:hypothetical protein
MPIGYTSVQGNADDGLFRTTDSASGDGVETCRKIQLRELTHANEMFPLFVYMAEQAKKKPPVLPDDAAGCPRTA